MNKRSIAAAVILFVTLVFALAPLYRSGDIPIPVHHAFHAMMMAGAALAGILLAGSLARERRSGAPWLLVAVFAPVIAMFLMWPSQYSYFEQHPYGHIAEHLGLTFLGFMAGYAGQRYANGIGWASGIGIVAMALLSVFGYGVAPTTKAQSVIVQSPAQPGAPPNVARGTLLFAQNCAVCHGAGGVGGEGPSLKNERVRKSLPAAEAWIENPAPPMPKLYPGTLSAQNVADLAGYIETLR
jgi:mono/diheme cytochrome c family protein